MKPRAFFLLILVFFVYSTSHAQLVRGYGLKLGVVAANQSWRYTGTAELPTDHRWGFTAVGYLELLDIPILSALVEVQYTQKGMSESLPITTESQPEGTGEFITKRPRVDYLSIPVLAKVRLSMPVVVPYLVAGPRLDFLLSKKGEGYDAVINKFKTTGFGATLGVGVEVTSLLPISLLAEFRYNPSFDDAFSNSFLTVKNRSLDFLLGVRL